MWDCGVAVVAFLLDAAGQKVSRRAIIKELEASRDGGVDLVEIVKFFKRRPEFAVDEKDNQTFESLEEEFKRGRVSLVAYQNWQKDKDIGQPDWGHYGVVVEIKGNKIYLFDPGERLGKTEFTKEEFEKRWYEDDLGIHYFHWAMSLAI